MAVMRFLVVLAVFSIAAVVRADDAPRFVPARYDEKARVVRFEAPVGVDWHAAARKHFRRFDFERPRAKDIAYLRTRIWEISGDAEETFRFAPERRVRRTTYTLISSAGITPLNVAAFEGTIRFGFDQAKPPNLTGVSYFGEAVSRRGQGSGGGVALLSKIAAPPTLITQARAELGVENKRAVLNYIEGETRVSATMPEMWHRSIDTAFAFRLGERRYLFVDWPADTTGFDALCAEIFSLYAVGKTLEEVASSTYNCDV